MNISLEMWVMVGLMAAAVWIAFTKLSCPSHREDARIAWLADTAEDAQAEEEAQRLSLRR